MREYVLASAIIWGAVIFAASVVAGDVITKLIPILGGGAAAHLVILGGACKDSATKRAK